MKRFHTDCESAEEAQRSQSFKPQWSVACSLLTALIALTLTGCAYTKIQIPMDKDFNQTQLGTREGTSNAKTVLYLVSWGDAGTRAAAEDGGITTIKHADRRIFSVLFGLYTKMTTVVYGD